MLLWRRKPVIFQGNHVALDGLSNVGNGNLASFALRDAPGKAWTFGPPKSRRPRGKLSPVSLREGTWWPREPQLWRFAAKIGAATTGEVARES